MNTTNLFVELIVIGIGTLFVLIFMILSVFGYEWIPWDKITSSTMLIPLLSVTYLLGIIIDRLADQIYRKWNRKLRLNHFSSNEEYHEARTYVYQFASERIISLFLYGRSRLRISRAWSLNCILLTMTIPLFICTRLSQIPNKIRISIIIFSIILFGLGAIVTCLTWNKLAKNEFAIFSLYGE